MMITFRRMLLLFLMLLLGLNLAAIFVCGSNTCFFCDQLPWFYVSLFLIFFGLSFLMAFSLRSGYHYPVICRGNSTEKSLSLTFDDGPDPVYTPVVLDVLKKHEVTATFFLIGSKLKGNEEQVKRMQEEGHLLGAHSWSHAYCFDFFPGRKIKKEFLRSNDLLREITGKTPLWFRPPYGVINPMVVKGLKNVYPHVIGWSLRSLDTVKKNPGKVLDKLVKNLHPGAIILLHDRTNFTQNHLETLITDIQRNGYQIVPLDQLLNIPAYEN